MSWHATPPNKLEIRLGLASRPQVVEWPVVEARPAAVLVTTPGGPLWIPLSRWLAEGAPLLQPYGRETEAACDAAMGRVLDFVRTLVTGDRDARVAVTSVAEGKTEKSRSVKLQVTVDAPGKPQRTLVRQKMVPASLLKQQDDGTWCLPMWFVKENILASFEKVEALPWAGLAAVEAQLREACTLAKADVIADQHQRAAEQARSDAEAARNQNEKTKREAEHLAGLARLRALAEEDGAFALAFVRRRMTLAQVSADTKHHLRQWPTWVPSDGLDAPLDPSMPCTRMFELLGSLVEIARRDPDFAPWRERNAERHSQLLKPRPAPKPKEPDRLIESCFVRWVEWVGPTTSRKRVDHEAEGCRVEVFGAKHLIHLADGRVLTKMKGPNLQIVEAGQDGAQVCGSAADEH